MKMLLLTVAVVLALMAGDMARGAGCGSRGGPGYRGPNGQCVGWANLNKVCGVPPTKNCTNEGGADLSAPAPKPESGKETIGVSRDRFPLVIGVGGIGDRV
jgi:hypothetical protein